MRQKNHRTSPFLLLLGMLYMGFGVQAQFLNRLHALDAGFGTVENGNYEDIACLDYLPGNEVNLIAIGTTETGGLEGMVSYNDVNGWPQMMQEFRHPNANTVFGRSIAELPSGDVVAVFFDHSSYATDVFKLNPGGGVVWSLRLEDFEPKDVTAAACNYLGGEGIWICGNAIDGRVAAFGFETNGTFVFGNKFDLFTASETAAFSTGEEIEYDVNQDRLVMVGGATLQGAGNLAMIYVRLNLNGSFLDGRLLHDSGNADSYYGIALEPFQHFAVHNFAASFIYTNSNGQYNGLTHLRPKGIPVWINYYPGNLIPSNNYINADLVTDNSILLAPGIAVDGGSPRAYSLTVSPDGSPAAETEYANSTNYPWGSSGFSGADFSLVLGQIVMVGRYRTQTNSGHWPEGPDPNSFYMVGANPDGVSECIDQNIPEVSPLDPVADPLSQVTYDMDQPIGSPLDVEEVDPLAGSNCENFKVGSFDEDAAEEPSVSIFYAGNNRFTLQSSQLPEQGSRVDLLDMQGKVLLTQQFEGSSIEIDASGLSQGIYLLRYQLAGVKNGCKKVIIQ